jgi:hypothetical protein
MLHWWNLATEDDRAYATELLKRHNENVDFAILMKADRVDERLIEANEVLTKIMEK